tara:strand:+ start:2121 stop:4061 length:1941 start_codon:yes stop_codon:yes gene_type:complete
MAIPILNHLDFQKTAEIQNVLLHTETTGNITSPGTGQVTFDTATAYVYNGSAWIKLNPRTITAGGNTLAETETLAFTAGTGITIAESAGAVTITSSVTDTNTWRTVTAGGNTLSTSETLAFTAGSGITIQESAGAVTITNSAAAGSSFGTIAVSGQSDVVADQANDTLTLVAAGGMTITQVAGTDTITLTSADTNTTYSVGDGGLTENDFTDADHSKLNAIEALADVTDTTNVTAAGALMDSEVTNLALVKGLAIGISDGNFLTANDAVADNDFLRIDGTEVEGLTVAEVLTALNVEAGADVTDTTNVTAAGALMDSELAGLAAVKATTGTFLSADESKLDGIEASADVTDTANVKSALNASFGGSATIGDSSDTFTIPGALIVTGQTTTNNVATVSTSNGVVFEGPTLDGHDGTLISVAASSGKTYTLPNVTGYVALFATDPGTTAIAPTVTEINYVDGVTSAIQTQLDAKQASDADLTALSSCQSGAATALALLTSTEVAILDGLTSTTAELNTLDGFDGDVEDLKYAKDLYDTGVTATEFDYLDGVTSNIQTQLDATEDASNKITKLLSGGAATTYNIEHDFGTPIVMVQVLDYGNAGSGATYDVVQVEIQRNDDDSVDLIFAAAPGTSQDYLVLITKFPAAS